MDDENILEVAEISGYIFIDGCGRFGGTLTLEVALFGVNRDWRRERRQGWGIGEDIDNGRSHEKWIAAQLKHRSAPVSAGYTASAQHRPQCSYQRLRNWIFVAAPDTPWRNHHVVHVVDTAIDPDGGERLGSCTNDSAWKAATPDNLLIS